MHVEYSTPECANPWDAVRYVEAGHQTMLNLIQKMTGERTPEIQTGLLSRERRLLRHGATWGCHESYQHRMNPAGLPRRSDSPSCHAHDLRGRGWIRSLFQRSEVYLESSRRAH